MGVGEGPLAAFGTPGALKPPVALSLAALVLGNLVPLAGAVVLGWSVFELLALFWAENVVIGAVNVLRMGTLLVGGRQLLALVLIPFFIVHYGMFSAVHGLFVLALFGPPELRGGGLAPAVAGLLATPGFALAVAVLAASHLVSFVGNFVVGGEWRRVDLKGLMSAPYGRVVVLHLTVIAGGMAVQALGQPVLALALLVALKIVADARAHLAERRRLAGA